jgi:hypothetical protein
MKTFKQFFDEATRTIDRALKLGDRLADKSKKDWEKQPPSYMQNKALSSPSHKLISGSKPDYTGMSAYKAKAERGTDVFDPKINEPNKTRIDIKKLIPSQAFTDWNSKKAKEKINDENPILVLHHNDKHYVIDGHHRIVAARLKGDSHIIANVQKV